MTRDELLKLKGDELATTINDLLSKFGSKNKICEALGLKKQSIDRKLKEAGYLYNHETKRYAKQDPNREDLKSHDDSKELIKDLLNRMEVVENRLNAIDSNKSSDFELVNFNSKMQNKNYRLYEEVVELIELIKRDHKHLNVTQVVNSALYRELIKFKK
mgnify:CR=1 FL=1